MPAPPSSPAELHEQFVEEMKEVDRAHDAGRLQEWVQEKLASERRNAGFDDTATA